MSDQISTTVRLPADLHQQLVQAADERCVSVNLLVVRALNDFLWRLIPVEQALRTRPEAP